MHKMKKKESIQPSHVLILGCGRSGTSIFGEFFQDLSAYTYYSEPPYADLKTYNYAKPIAIKVPTESCLLYTSPSPRDATLSRMPSSA